MSINELVASVYRDCGRTYEKIEDRETRFVSRIASDEVSKIFAAQEKSIMEVRNVG
ncbi:hypothetical protein [Sulfurimonas sp.]|uniref:hypothetical protein n=1 Tax=Sulfurimonas sp. TaxID=2022749 RepID=UPI0025EA652C|nr:hypothetical protein [Sulfurimonas sp.]